MKLSFLKLKMFLLVFSWFDCSPSEREEDMGDCLLRLRLVVVLLVVVEVESERAILTA